MFQVPVELQALVDIYDQPFFIIDDDHQVLVVNRAFENAYQVEGTVAAGTPCYHLLARHGGPRPCGSKGHSCPFAETFSHEVTRTAAFSYRDAEGREHLVKVQSYPLRAENGRVYAGVLLQRDAFRDHAPGRPTCLPPHMVGKSPSFKAALDRLLAAARTDAPVLIRGETGTGKELAADFVHRNSARRASPFQTIDCSVLTEELFESEVFGHERGAFTGSTGEKRGLMELADGGTLFLDEIGELSHTLQAKLLRVLESGEFRRVGSVKTRRVNTRIISATNRDLLGAPWFRSDLYYRIACMSVRMPNVAERRSDIPLLAAELLKRIGHSAGCQYALDDGALRVLRRYDFPGNIREMRNILWLAAVNARDGRIGAVEVAAALPDPADSKRSAFVSAPTEIPPPPPGALPIGEWPRPGWSADILAEVLSRHGGNRRAVANFLGVSERTVYRKLREFGLN